MGAPRKTFFVERGKWLHVCQIYKQILALNRETFVGNWKVSLFAGHCVHASSTFRSKEDTMSLVLVFFSLSLSFIVNYTLHILPWTVHIHYILHTLAYCFHLPLILKILVLKNLPDFKLLLLLVVSSSSEMTIGSIFRTCLVVFCDVVDSWLKES